MRINISHFYTAIIAVVLVAGCAGNPSMPTGPEYNPDTGASSQPESSGHACLGFYQMALDTETGQIETDSLRSGQIHLNVVGILYKTAGISVVGVPSEYDPANGIFVFDISLAHPYEPQPSLTGFDVKGILITDGSRVENSVTIADLDETRLLNADGYSRWWNPSEFTRSGIFGY
ncbi:MAG: hypothetical protein ABIC40_01140 [bacterium]